MDAKTFEQIFEAQVEQSRAVLVAKAKEYANDDDRLHNFKLASHLIGGTPEQALWAFDVKHIISLRDMILSGKEFPEEVWLEKLGDYINYGFLLRALIVDTGRLTPAVAKQLDQVINPS